MTMDIALLATMIVAFALFVTVHLALVVGLFGRAPRWRAPLALVVPPLAVLYGSRERMWTRVGLWGFAVIAYVAARVLAVAWT